MRMQYGRSGKLEASSPLAVDGPVTGLPKVILGQRSASRKCGHFADAAALDKIS